MGVSDGVINRACLPAAAFAFSARSDAGLSRPIRPRFLRLVPHAPGFPAERGCDVSGSPTVTPLPGRR